MNDTAKRMVAWLNYTGDFIRTQAHKVCSRCILPW